MPEPARNTATRKAVATAARGLRAPPCRVWLKGSTLHTMSWQGHQLRTLDRMLGMHAAEPGSGRATEWFDMTCASCKAAWEPHAMQTRAAGRIPHAQHLGSGRGALMIGIIHGQLTALIMLPGGHRHPSGQGAESPG